MRRRKNVYFTDIENNRIMRRDPSSVRSTSTGHRPGAPMA